MKKGCILILQLFILISINIKPVYANTDIISGVDYNKILQINDINSNNMLQTTNDLSNIMIEIEGYNLNFHPNITNYTLTIGDETKLNIKTDYNPSKIIINGNTNLKNGSIITITFIDKYDNKNTYIINIKKKENSKIYFIIIIFILLIINITRILINSTKREKII